MMIYNSENMSIICLYMYHYVCMYGRKHCNQGFTFLKDINSLIKKTKAIL